MANQWFIQDGLLYITGEVNNQQKILGFDLDGTLIKTKSGNKFPKNADDWQWLAPNVMATLQHYRQTYQLIIFSNQAGFEKKPQDQSAFITKMNTIFQQLGFIIPTYVSTGKNKYRKPSPLMFGQAFPGRHIESFTFIGDAAGRPNDFSDSDYKFAINVQAYYGITTYFSTPEAFFFERTDQPYSLSGFDASTYINPYVNELPTPPNQTLILLVGRPASGKSKIAEKYAAMGYSIVSQDVLGTKAKTLTAARQALDNGRSVVVDNTNGNPANRAEFINLARSKGVPVEAILIEIPHDLNQHLNIIRNILGQKELIPDVAYRTFDKYYSPPSNNEGISKITTLGFTLHDENPEFNRLYFLRF